MPTMISSFLSRADRKAPHIGRIARSRGPWIILAGLLLLGTRANAQGKGDNKPSSGTTGSTRAQKKVDNKPSSGTTGGFNADEGVGPVRIFGEPVRQGD
jgi:hypothetical protein